MRGMWFGIFGALGALEVGAVAVTTGFANVFGAQLSPHDHNWLLALGFYGMAKVLVACFALEN